MDKLRAMQTFVQIVDDGSLTAAAASLDSSLPAVVRTLASLERLGELLAGSSSPHERAGRPRLVGVGSTGRMSRAAVVGGRATLSRVRASRVTAEPPRAMDGDGGDRTTARPLR